MTNLFNRHQTFCIVTGEKHALACLREAYANGYQFNQYGSAELCPFETFFAEYPETSEKPQKLTFRFSRTEGPEPFETPYNIGWASERYYREQTAFPVYTWEEVVNMLAPPMEEFLSLI